MIERLGLTTLEALEAALVDLGSAIELPPTPDVAPAVGERLRAAPVIRTAGPNRLRPLRRGLLLAAALALLVAGVALGLRVGLDLLRIEFGPVPTPTAPVTTPSPSATNRLPGQGLGLGQAATLDDARDDAEFTLAEPTDLGPPDAVFVGGPSLRGQVSFVYAARPELPASDLLDGAGLLITQNAGGTDPGLANKLVDSGIARVEAVTVDGAPGYWISGAPHWFWYLDPAGQVIEEGRRLVGDTLVWERDGILYRIEGDITKARALEIASTIR